MAMQFARRLTRLKESGTLKVLDKVKALQAKGAHIIQLDVGEPDFNTPANVNSAAKAALDSGYTHYTPSSGIPALRDAVAESLRRENGLDYRRENIIITPGSKQALFYAIMAAVDEGDEVIIPTPAWPSYMEMVTVAGGRSIEVPCRPGFGLDLEALKAALSGKTKLIILNSPNNPTGCVYPDQELRAVAELAADAKVSVISDEIYEKIIYEGRCRSLGSFPGMSDLVITVNGFSKTYAMTGWRIGYAAGPKEFISAMNKLQQHSASCPSSFVQKGALEALKPETPVAPMIAEFRRRRDYICRELAKIRAFKVEPPKGAFYLFPDISASGMPSSQFVDLLLEKAGVSTTPGEPFGGYGGNMRISYANSMPNLEAAVDRIRQTLEPMGLA
jgi:aspartate aminotransferase